MYISDSYSGSNSQEDWYKAAYQSSSEEDQAILDDQLMDQEDMLDDYSLMAEDEMLRRAMEESKQEQSKAEITPEMQQLSANLTQAFSGDRFLSTLSQEIRVNQIYNQMIANIPEDIVITLVNLLDKNLENIFSIMRTSKAFYVKITKNLNRLLKEGQDFTWVLPDLIPRFIPISPPPASLPKGIKKLFSNAKRPLVVHKYAKPAEGTLLGQLKNKAQDRKEIVIPEIKKNKLKSDLDKTFNEALEIIKWNHPPLETKVKEDDEQDWNDDQAAPIPSAVSNREEKKEKPVVENQDPIFQNNTPPHVNFNAILKNSLLNLRLAFAVNDSSEESFEDPWA